MFRFFAGRIPRDAPAAHASDFRLRGWCVAACATACLAALVPRAHAQPVMNEQDINEQAVTRALTPDAAAADDALVTRGFVLSNKRPGAGGAPAPARKPTASMLITFASNSSTLTPRAMAALDKVGRALQSEQLAAYRFRVEGHADPRGSLEANMRLSEERAAAVVEYLTTRDGISPERLSSVGKGSSEPLNQRNPAAPENRRVTIVTIKD